MIYIYAVLSCSVMSDSLQPHGTVVHQVPLSMGILQARILEWFTMLSSRGSSQLRAWTQVSHIAGRFFTVWATTEAHIYTICHIKVYICAQNNVNENLNKSFIFSSPKLGAVHISHNSKMDKYIAM